MSSTLFKHNIILLVLCIGMTLFHNSSQAEDDDASKADKPEHTIDLYYTLFSAPCRSVMLTAAYLKVKLNMIPINLVTHENLKDDFTAINPQHTLPTIDDDGFRLWESRAIMVYLVRQYGENDHSLFPADIDIQAKINEKLQFDLGKLFPPFIKQYSHWIFRNVPRTTEKDEAIHEVLLTLNKTLEDSEFVAGDSMTVADIALVASISTFEAVEVDLKKYTHITKWLETCKLKLPEYDTVNQPGIDLVKSIYKQTSEKQVVSVERDHSDD